MKVRFLNTYEPVVPLFRDLAPVLVARGMLVEIVVSAVPYRSGQPLREFFKRHRGVRVTEAPGLGAKPGRPFARLGAILGYLGYVIPLSLLRRGVDLNVFLTQPPLFGAWGLVLRRVRGQRYICILMDLYPHLLVELGFLRRHSWRVRLAAAAVRGTVRNAEAVVVVGRCMKSIVAEMGVPEARIHVVPPWPSSAVVPVDHSENQFRDDQPWRDKFVVMYAGNIGYPQNFDDLLGAADRLEERRDIEFVFVGSGAREAEVKAEAERRRLENVSFLPFSHDRYPLADIMSAADMHFVPLRSECTGLAVPSKALAAFAAGRPVIYDGASHGEIAALIHEHGGGVVLVPGDVETLAEVIVAYADDRDRWGAECLAARSLAEQHLNGKASAERLADIIADAPAEGYRADG